MVWGRNCAARMRPTWVAVASSVRITNERGQVVGRSTLAGDGGYRAFLWQRGAMRNLGPLGDNAYSYAADINDRGQVVGVSSRHADSGDERAFLWQRGTMIDLGAAAE